MKNLNCDRYFGRDYSGRSCFLQRNSQEMPTIFIYLAQDIFMVHFFFCFSLRNSGAVTGLHWNQKLSVTFLGKESLDTVTTPLSSLSCTPVKPDARRRIKNLPAPRKTTACTYLQSQQTTSRCSGRERKTPREGRGSPNKTPPPSCTWRMVQKKRADQAGAEPHPMSALHFSCSRS